MRNLLWLLVTLCTCLGLATGASAAPLLIDENFSYTTGTLLTANGWTNHSGTTNFIPVSASGLTYAGYPSSGIGNAASLTTSGEDVNRTYANQTSGSVYYAFLVNVSVAQATGDYFTHLGTNAWTTTFPGRVFCRSASGGVNFGVSRAGTGTSVVWASGVYALNTTHLLVLKYTFVAGAANDIVSLFVDPSSCPGEPSPTVTAGTEAGAEPTGGIGGVGLRQGTAAQAPTLWIDGLRIGLSWLDVVCGTPTTGACCAADGSCSVQTQADCTAAGGVYSGAGTSCSPNLCPQPGACCALDGTCTFVLQANCTGAWNGGACTPNPCTQPIGSCCALDGTCTVTTQANCAATWTLGGVCVPNTCPQPSGSCCYPDGSCVVNLLADCTGTWTMFGACVPNLCPQPTGACCLPSGGLCSVGTAADCAAAAGLYQGNGTTCAPNPCPALTKTLCEVAEDDVNGVALLVGQHVTVQGIALCNGMTWSTTIREFQITDGNCCIDVFGGTLTPTVALGDLVQVTGTVSNYNGKTELTTPDLAVAVLSSGNPVPAPGVTTTGTLAAAGEPFESCLFTIHCASIVSGTWPAAGADANIVIDDGTGPVTMRIDKDTDIDGSPAPTGPFTVTGIGDQFDATSPYTTGWQIKPRSLADFVYDCTPGACCFPDGSCLVMTAPACASQNGSFSGDNTNCSPNNCAQPTGACCLPGDICAVESAADCAAASGVYKGDGTTCTPDPCVVPVKTLCEVAEDDVNGVALLVGQRVTVQGIALCDGMNWSTTVREFQITDGTCCIDIFGGALTPTVALGDLVQVTGTVSNYNGKTEISTPGMTVTVLSSGNPIPTPGVTTTGALAAGGEAFESCLFKIHCVSIISGTWPAAGLDANIVIDDGTGPVTMRIDKDTDIPGTPAPVGPFTVTGIGDQYDTTSPYTTGWQIKPRFLDDLVMGCGNGACCSPDGSCVTTPQADCAGVWLGYDTVCDPNPCEQPTGSCCQPDGACQVVVHSACTGDWTVGGVCNPNPCPVTGVDGGVLDSILGVQAKPNPFTGSVSLRVAGPKGTEARVLVFDAGGRLVRTAWSGMLNGRAFTVTWDGRDDSGRQAATGIYMVRLESGPGDAIVRIVKLR
jgi:DNA/RNA endonuclease YhcR with UshA esterase domain